jgi:hypothetical protein
VSVASEPPIPHAAEQPVLLRLAEFGPPAEHAVPAPGWRSPLLAGLPRMQPAAGGPVLVRRMDVARPARVLITEAEARGLAGTMARAVLEALEGRRSARQLATMLSERALATVQTMRRGGLRWPIRRAAVGTVRVFFPCRDAIEACVTFHCDGRTRVLVLRIDRERRRWVGTAVRIG